MINPDKLFGRLSNRMFQMAALLSYCWDNDYHMFLQDEKYFKKYEAQIKQLYGEGIKPNSIDRVAIHIRRGKNPINPEEPAYHENPFYENLSHHLHENLDDNYYIRAMKLFPGEKFVVVSDDIEWCKQQEAFKDCEFSTGTEIEDLNGMANCKHIIGSNSSFSWWAAWLGEYPGRRCVFPKKWFAKEEDERFVGVPERWERI